MDSCLSSAKTIRQDPMCLKHSQGNAIDIRDAISVQLLQPLKLRIRSFPENLDTPIQFNTSVTGNAHLEKPPPEVSPPEQSPNATIKS